MILDFSKYNSLRSFHFAQMNKLLYLRKAEYCDDDMGGFEEEWVDYAEVWAKIIPMSYFKDTDLYRKKADVWLVMRYDAGIVAGMRALHENTLYNFDGVVNVDSKFIIVSAREVINA